MSRAGTPPSPEVDPGREARIRAYAERADRGEPLFGGAPPADVVADAPAPGPVASLACMACGGAFERAPRGGRRKRFCGPACAERWAYHSRVAEERGEPQPEPGSLPPGVARRREQRPRDPDSPRSVARRAAAEAPAPRSHGGYSQAVRDDPRDDARDDAPSAPLGGSPLLRALAAGLRAAADVLDESLGGGA